MRPGGAEVHPGWVNQHLADLLGLDLTDPEVIAALAEQQEITTIRARVREVLTRTGTTEAALVALLGITADKTRASLAGERRFSTYELAVIATHGKTTVEWLAGEWAEYERTEYVRVRIDLNARTHDGLYVPARRSRASGPVERGDLVTVFEPDDGVMTTATVKRLNDDWVHLDVDWDNMREIPARELDVWRNPHLAQRIRDAYAETEHGEGIDLGSFEQYLDDEPMPPEVRP